MTISIKTPSGLEKQSISSGVTFKMTSTPTALSIKVDPVSEINGAVTSYMVSLQSSIMLVTGDQLTFTLPAEVSISEDKFDCALTTNLEAISCTPINSNTGINLVLTVPGGTLPKNSIIEFVITGLINPPSTKPSSSFTDV